MNVGETTLLATDSASVHEAIVTPDDAANLCGAAQKAGAEAYVTAEYPDAFRQMVQIHATQVQRAAMHAILTVWEQQEREYDAALTERGY